MVIWEAKGIYYWKLSCFATIRHQEPARSLPHWWDALVIPVKSLGFEYDSDAVDFVVEYTQGYPYFLQEYGKFLWDETSDSPISRSDATQVLPLVEAKLDESFFRVRADRTTDLELKYLYAMAELGPDPHRASEVARRIQRTTEQAGPIRSRLIDKGLLYTPGHGFAAFTVPQFDRYMLRRHSGLLDNQEHG